MSALTDTFTAIANAIRGKLGVQTTYTPTQMSSAIASIPTAKEEQTKSVTATTSAQTVTPDTGKVLSSVTVNPQVHSATYTPTGYSNANDMGAQNNYRYVDTSAYEPTSITPSNDPPVALVADTGYKPTAGGYAIESYDSIQPSNIPRDVASGDIVKINTYSAKIIRDTYLYDLTPSDSNPVLLSGQQNFHVTGSSGVSQGFAIASQPASKTPSDTSPAAVTSGSIIKPSSAGYLYKTQQTKGITLLGSITIADTSSHMVSLSQSIKNFRYIMVCMGSSVATNKYYANNTGGGCGSVIIFDTDKWVSGFTLDGGYTTGNSGSQSTRTDTVSYSTNSAITIKHSNSTSRTDYIYGIN